MGVADEFLAQMRPLVERIGPVGPRGMTASQSRIMEKIFDDHPDAPTGVFFESVADGAQRFICQMHITEEMVKFGFDLLVHNMLPVPAQKGVYEFRAEEDGRGLEVAVAADQIGDELRAVAVGRLKREESGIMPSSMMRLALTGNDDDARVNIAEAPNRTDEDEREAAQHIIMTGFPLMIGLFAAMTLKDVERRTELPSERTNRKRVERGDKPLPARHTLTLKYGAEVVVDAVAAGGSHASPRYHFRRGHMRTLLRDAAERKVRVRPTWVGDPTLGEITKAYRVIGSEK